MGVANYQCNYSLYCLLSSATHRQVLSPMKTTVVSHQSGTVRLQIDIDISGSMLAVEERIQDAVNDLGRAATGLALEQFDTDGSPVMTGSINPASTHLR